MIERLTTVWALIEQRAAETPDDLLAVDERDETLSFAGLRDRACTVAAGLFELGVRPGSSVTWQLPTWIESLVLCAALARLGAVQNPVIPASRQREVEFITAQIGAEWLIVPTLWRGFDYESMARAVAAEHPGLQVLPISSRQLPEGPAHELPPYAAPADDPVRWILFTSGTTSDPKGARHTDSSLIVSALNMSRRLAIGPADRLGIAFPFTHIGGFTILLADLICGSASILLEQFSEEGISVLARNGVTLAGSGTVFNLAYLKAQREAGPDPIFPAVRGFPGGGSPRPETMHAEMQETFGAGIFSGYGLTETGFLAMAGVDDPDEARAVTEGRPYPGVELRIIDAEGQRCPAGVEGEICARGPGVMQGYVDASLGSAFDAEGYFHTGDLGVQDEEGFVRITGRLKEIIIRKGENISAREVEDLLHTHPGIVESAVIGLPDARSGERCCAVVVLAEETDLTLEDVRDHLVGKGLSLYKVPEQLEIIGEIPRNSSGKVPKHVLVRRFSPAPSVI